MRQYVDWRPFRRVTVDSAAFGQAIDRFCGKIAETLREPRLSPEERRQLETEAGRPAAQVERIRVEAEAQRQAPKQEELRTESQARKPIESKPRKYEEAERQQSVAEEWRNWDDRTRAKVGAHRPAEGNLPHRLDAGEMETEEQSSRPKRLSRRLWMIACIFAAVVAAGAAMWWNQYRLTEEVHPQTTAIGSVPAAEKEENNTLTNATPLTAAQELALKPADSFKECAECPEMIVVPTGRFRMGSGQGNPWERPPRDVTIAKPFAVAKFAVTFNEWDACAADDHGCRKNVGDNAGRGQRPVNDITWKDTQDYIKWLSRITRKPYRLLSEAEYEYAARAGDEIKLNGKSMANRKGEQTVPVGRSPRTVLVCMIWWAVASSGRRIATTTTMRELQPMARHGGRRLHKARRPPR